MRREALGLVAERFRALSDATRLEILQHLETGDRTVGEIVEAVGTSQPNVSKHLRVLEQVGFVRRTAQGNAVVCSIADPTVSEICDAVCRGARARLRAQAAAL
jgi:DNA-binding transcriptional ArsR family regulator